MSFSIFSSFASKKLYSHVLKLEAIMILLTSKPCVMCKDIAVERSSSLGSLLWFQNLLKSVA